MQRLTTAEFLHANGFSLDAVYLAGYGVECALKALVLSWTPQRQFESMVQQLTEVGAKGHDFEYLKGLLKERRRGRERRDSEMLGELSPHLSIVASWSTDLRYQVGLMDPDDAQQFIESAKAIQQICGRS